MIRRISNVSSHSIMLLQFSLISNCHFYCYLKCIWNKNLDSFVCPEFAIQIWQTGCISNSYLFTCFTLEKLSRLKRFEWYYFDLHSPKLDYNKKYEIKAEIFLQKKLKRYDIPRQGQRFKGTRSRTKNETMKINC